MTGSGKTLVYLSLVNRVLADGRRAIVLVPEISLTPQTIRRFHRSFGKRVAVIHSGLSLSERLDEYKRIRRGMVDIVVGTRSAVFAPVENLGLIVVDEEQEHTYLSEKSPRYDAREIARLRAKYHHGLAVLASATPSVESRYRAQKGEYLFARLPMRYGEAILPAVTILDLREKPMAAEALSEELCEELYYNLQHKEQSILLVNRRGYSATAQCMSCHQPVQCPNCSISLKYHAANDVPLLRLQHRGAPGVPAMRQQADALLRRWHPEGGGSPAASLSRRTYSPDGSGHHHATRQPPKAARRIRCGGI